MLRIYVPKFLVRYYRKRVIKYRDKYSSLIRDLESSRLPTTAPKILASSTFYGAIAGVLGVLIGYHLSSSLLSSAVTVKSPGLFSNLPRLSLTLQHVQILVTLFIAVLTFLLVRYAILFYPKYVSSMRKGSIERALPYTSNIMLGMAKGGVPLISIFKFVAENEDIFEEISVEFAKVVELYEMTKSDLSSAILYVARTTPSDKLKNFLENLVNVFGGGGDIVEYLKNVSSRFFAEKEKFYSVLFETLQILAEFYLVLFIVTPLTLLIMLVVFRMVQAQALNTYKLVAYFLIPLGSMLMLYILYLTVPKEPGGIVRRYTIPEVFIARVREEVTRFKVDNLKRNVRRIRNYLLAPFTQPIYSLGIRDVIIYLLLPAVAFASIFVGKLSYDLFMFSLIVALLLPAVVFAEYRERVVRNMERMLPEFLRQMAALNEAGLNIVDTMRMLTEFEFGVLTRELRKVKREIEWGELLSKALRRVEFRVRSPIFARVLSQVAKAMESTPSISDALLTASIYSEMEIDARDRIRAQMGIYALVIYIAFGVFLFTSYILLHNLIGTNVQGAPFLGITPFSKDLVVRAFFETTMIIGLFSGFVAGMMSEGRIEAGLKHVLILMTIAFVFYKFVI